MYKGKRYGIPLDVHPLGFFYNKTVMEKAGLDPEKPPTTARRVRGRAGRAQGQGHPGPLGHAVPVHRRAAVPGADLAVRRRAVQRRRHRRRSWNADGGRQGADLVRRPGEERATARRTSRQDADIIAVAERQGRVQLERHLEHQHAQARVKGLEWGVAPLPKIGDQAGRLGRLAPVRACRSRSSRTQNKLDRRPRSSSTGSASSRSSGPRAARCRPARRSASSAEFKALTEQAALGHPDRRPALPAAGAGHR